MSLRCRLRVRCYRLALLLVLMRRREFWRVDLFRVPDLRQVIDVRHRVDLLQYIEGPLLVVLADLPHLALWIIHVTKYNRAGRTGLGAG